MDFFFEQSALELLIDYVKKNCARGVCVQLLQTFNILFENLKNERAVYYLLSQNHANEIILHDYDFSDEEIIGYYMALLKSLSFRVNETTINFFFDEAMQHFPLYLRTLHFFNHSEAMVRIAVRTITLNIFKVHHVPCALYIYACTSVPYFLHLANEMRKTSIAINEFICLTLYSSSRGKVESLIEAQLDHLHYIDDIFSLGIPDLTDVLFLVLLQRVFLPLYVHSLNKRHPPSLIETSDSQNFLFHSVAMFLLSHVFTILHQPDLIRIMTEAIFIGDLAFLCPVLPSPADVSGADELNTTPGDVEVVDHLRAAHYGRSVVRCSPVGCRLLNFIRIAAEFGFPAKSETLSTSLSDDVATTTLAIRSLPSSNSSPLKEAVRGKFVNPTKLHSLNLNMKDVKGRPVRGNQEYLPTKDDPLIERNTISPLSTTPVLQNRTEENSPAFSLSGKPFLRAIIRSLEVGPGTDYDTLFALTLLIAIKLNGGQDESTLDLAQIGTPSATKPCNSMLLMRVLDIIVDASRPGSRVRLITLNLALYLLVILTRDDSLVCHLTESQNSQLLAALTASREISRDFYMVEQDFLDIFENEVCRYRRQKLHPSACLQNPELLVYHACDEIKLSSVRSEENLHASSLSSASSTSRSFCHPLPFSGAAAYVTLPVSELECMQHAVAVFLCIHSYFHTFFSHFDASVNRHCPAYETTIQPIHRAEISPPDLSSLASLSWFGNIPLLGKSILSIGDPINISQQQIFSCEIEHEISKLVEKRYLIVSELQLLLVEPCHRRIGWGTVTFAGLLQEIYLKLDPNDSRCLNITVYKPGEKSLVATSRIASEINSPLEDTPVKLSPIQPLMTARLRFQNPIPCSTICNMISHQCDGIRSTKLIHLRRLLQISDNELRRSCNLSVNSLQVPRTERSAFAHLSSFGANRTSSEPVLDAPFSGQPTQDSPKLAQTHPKAVESNNPVTLLNKARGVCENPKNAGGSTVPITAQRSAANIVSPQESTNSSFVCSASDSLTKQTESTRLPRSEISLGQDGIDENGTVTRIDDEGCFLEDDQNQDGIRLTNLAPAKINYVAASIPISIESSLVGKP